MSNTPKNKRKTPPVSEVGSLPPQSKTLEDRLLGIILLESKAYDKISEWFQSSDIFYFEHNKTVFKAILSLYNNHKPIDIVLVVEELEKSKELTAAGGAARISDLTSSIGSSVNIEEYATELLIMYVQRQMISISADVQKKCFDKEDVFQTISTAEGDIMRISNTIYRTSDTSLKTAVYTSIKEVEAIAKNPGQLTGVDTGFPNLNYHTNGWQPTDLIILAARPGMGKTALLLSLARNAAKRKQPVAIFSLEMSTRQLTNRLISTESGVPSEKLKRGDLSTEDWKQINSSVSRLENYPIEIDDTPALNVFALRSKIRRLIAEKNIQLVVVDYLQLLTLSNERISREQEISKISGTLKAIAKELNIPIIALSQLSRAVESRGGDKKPMLQDLRDSGAIEQDADIVSFLYRPAYYGILEDENGDAYPDGYAELNLAKNRNGKITEIALIFNQKTFEFTQDERISESITETAESSNPFNDMPTSNDFNDFFKTKN